MSPKPILYQIPSSPSVRTVLMVAKEIGLDLELRYVDTLKNEHKSPDFSKINPQHTVPTLDDNGKYLWDSHAIATYLIGKYGQSNDHPLYPTDLFERARIDQRLQFNGGVLYPALTSLFKPIYYGGETELSDKAVQDTIQAFTIVESFLGSNPYVVGNQLTVADLAMITVITQLNIMVPIDEEVCPNVLAWMKRVEETVPYFEEVNREAIESFKTTFEESLAKNQANL